MWKQQQNSWSEWLCMCVFMLSMYWCMCVQHEMQEVCLVCVWHGIEAQNEHNVYKHTSNDQNMHVQSKDKNRFGTHLIPIQHKIVTRTFWQTPSMQQCISTMNNAWTWWNMPQYMLRMPQGANTDANTSNGTQPNQNFGKPCTKLRNLTLFRKNPQFWKP